MSNLPGIIYDQQAQSDLELQCSYYRTLRAFYISLHYLLNKKYKESLGFCFRVESYLKQLEPSLASVGKNTEIEREKLRQFEAQLNQLKIELNQSKYKIQTNVILEDDSVSMDEGSKENEMERGKLEKTPLNERLDVYCDDPKVTANVVKMALEFEPIPCKPLFFDLALNHVELPSYDDKIDAKKQTQPAGVKGFIKGFFGF